MYLWGEEIHNRDNLEMARPNGHAVISNREQSSVNVAFGHTNMDFDCLGSLILVKKLFPDYRLVRQQSDPSCDTALL
jgi:hypothetical protein